MGSARLRAAVPAEFALKALIATIVGGWATIIHGTSTTAQTLPPPPNVPLPSAPSAPLPTVPIQPIPSQPGRINTITPLPGERIYQAPGASPIRSNSGFSGRGYRVIVNSDDPSVLQQVRFVQSDAFFQNIGGRRVIQAGIFSDEVNARQQVSLLASRGYDARITNQSGSPSFSEPIQEAATTRGVYVVVPGNRANLVEYRDRTVQLGVPRQLILLRSRPFGPHMAVGPFESRREAERVAGALRSSARLDARLYYGR